MTRELPTGWYTDEELAYLLSALRRRQPRVIVEVGSLFGRSALAIAQAMRPTAHLLCVDIWPDERVFNAFTYAVEQAGLSERVTPQHMSSIEAASVWQSKIANQKSKIDLLHLDGDHRSLGVYLDIREWLPCLAPDGLFIGHDWGLDSVQFGVMQARAEGLLREVGVSDVQRHGKPALWWGLPGTTGT
ncbi:MAG: class I SAM-dependent methyltransferase [Planctomycetes bacterium]|nr:class I SAM-dependent methyltransferase [Planctomycetota bacterium]